MERIPTPGAATIAPRSENAASRSSGPVAPTEMMLSRARFAGNDGEAAESFPAAATNSTPLRFARAIAFAITWLVPFPPHDALITRAPCSAAKSIAFAR